MKIVIIGAGAVGCDIARRLVSEDKTVAMVDIDKAAPSRLKNSLDVEIVTGLGSYSYQYQCTSSPNAVGRLPGRLG